MSHSSYVYGLFLPLRQAITIPLYQVILTKNGKIDSICICNKNTGLLLIFGIFVGSLDK